MGPASEVSRVIAEAQAGQIPITKTSTYLAQEGRTSSGGAIGGWSSWFRVVGDEVQVRHMVRCEGELSWRSEWLTIGPDGTPVARPQDYIPALRDNVTRRVPSPVPRIAPADEDANGWTYVNLDTYFWVDGGPGQWDVVSATASVPGLSVTVQAVPQRLVVDPGDGSRTFSCEGQPPVASNAVWYEGMPGCVHRYVNSSAMAGNEQTFPVVLAIDWSVTWSASNGEAGDLGSMRTTSAVRPLAVAEIQAVLVPNP